MELSYKQLEATLAGYLSIHPESRGTFRSRIKQLQRLGFPPGVNVGHGVRVTYSTSQLLKMVTAFDLIGFGLAADTAIRLVEDSWRNWITGFALAARDYFFGTHRPLYAIVTARSFGKIQFDDNPMFTRRELSLLEICDEPNLIKVLEGGFLKRRANGHFVFLLSNAYRKAMTAAGEHGGVSLSGFAEDELLEHLPYRAQFADSPRGRPSWLHLSWDAVETDRMSVAALRRELDQKLKALEEQEAADGDGN